MNRKAPVTLVTVVKDDAKDLRGMLASVRDYVDEIIVGVQPSEDDTKSVALAFADTVVELPQTVHIEMQVTELSRSARNEVILHITPDERLENIDKLSEVVAIDADVWLLERVDFIDGQRVQYWQSDIRVCLFKRGAVEFQPKMHTYPKLLSDKVYETREMWISHLRRIETIRKRIGQFNTLADSVGEGDRVIPIQSTFLAKAESLNAKIVAGGYPRKILLSYNGMVGIGDVIMTTPAVREIRRQYPKAEITYLTQVSAAVRNNPYIDRVINIKPEQWKPENESKYDLVIHWERSLTGKPGERLNGYELESQWAFVKPENYHPEWFVSKTEDRFARSFLANNIKTARVVGFSLRASSLHRTWPHSVEFVEKLLNAYEDVSIIFFGTPDCRMLEMQYSELLAPIRDNWGVKRLARLPYSGPGADRIVRTSGLLNLREVAAITKHLDLMITPDSGLMHIAACFDIPTVAYFNLVPPELRVKHLPTVRPVAAQYECSPCFEHGKMWCEKMTELGAPCLHTITVDDMLKLSQEVLG